MPNARRAVFASTFVVLLLAVIVAVGSVYGWDSYPAAWHVFVVGPRHRQLRGTTFQKTPERLARGQYLVEGPLACLHCHSDRDWNSPGAPESPGKVAAGHNFVDFKRPWMNAANLTSDSATGAARWTDDMLARAIREGVSHDGRIMAPNMPYSAYKIMSDEDLASVIVFIRSLPPISNPLPDTQLPLDRKLLYWNLPTPILSAVPEPDRSTPEKRGAYLVKLANCTGCHSDPKTLDDRGSPLLFGGGIFIRGPFEREIITPNITSDPSGISYYDSKLFIQVMRTGYVGARPLNSMMPWRWFGNMTDDDLTDVFAYLRALKPVHHLVDNTEPPTLCRICRKKHGSGDRN